MTTPSLSRTLRHICRDEPGTLRAAVAAEALEHDEPALFLTDVVRWGGMTGIVRSLIYYSDTTAFALSYYGEILELRAETEDARGMPLTLGYELLNDLAWFAFEETAYRLADELGLEI